MGYTTDFYGAFNFNKPVEKELVDYINTFSSTRRMKRDNEKIKELIQDWQDKCFNGNLGNDGEYYIGGDGFMGQMKDNSILSYNEPPASQPGLWCQWVINDNNELVWDQGEKFYHYTEWLEYLIKHFFEPLGYVLNGEMQFQGEDINDFGIISIVDNIVFVENGDLCSISEDNLLEALIRSGCKVDL